MECNQVTLLCNQVNSGNMDTSAQVLLISGLYVYHKINEIKCEWWLHVMSQEGAGHLYILWIYFLPYLWYCLLTIIIVYF